MFKWFKNKKKDNKGFTLVELVIVIAILAILVGLLAPQYTKYVEKSRKAADASNMDEMVKVIKVYSADPANELEMGHYVISMGVSATSITAKGQSLKTTDATDGLDKEMKDSIPKWWETKLKSQKWGSKGAPATIIADVEVLKDGGTTVTYSSQTTANKNDTDSKFAKYMQNGTAE